MDFTSLSSIFKIHWDSISSFNRCPWGLDPAKEVPRCASLVFPPEVIVVSFRTTSKGHLGTQLTRFASNATFAPLGLATWTMSSCMMVMIHNDSWRWFLYANYLRHIQDPEYNWTNSAVGCNWWLMEFDQTRNLVSKWSQKTLQAAHALYHFAVSTVPPSSKRTQLSGQMSCPARNQCALPAPWLFPSCCASCRWRPGATGNWLMATIFTCSSPWDIDT